MPRGIVGEKGGGGTLEANIGAKRKRVYEKCKKECKPIRNQREVIGQPRISAIERLKAEAAFWGDE